MKLSLLTEGLGARHLFGPAPEALEVQGLTRDSRLAGPGVVFVAVPGTGADGHAFAAAAVAAGSPAVILEHPVEGLGEACVLEVDRARLALALAAANLHGRPGQRLPLVGITGTNGKTTVAHLLEAVATAAGRRIGLLGTTGHRFLGQTRAADHTTPGAEVLQGLLAEMLAEGADLGVLEVSSHALDQERVAGCRFAVAAFTNLTRDHLDYHPDLDAYFDAKRRLFTEHLAEDGVAVINLDDPWGARLAEGLWGEGRRLVGTSTVRGAAHPGAVRVHAAHLGLDGIQAELLLPEGRMVALRSPLVGAHNLQNLCTAVGLGFALGFPSSALIAGLGTCVGAPGRLERVSEVGAGARHVFVDYAHTDDALARVLGALRELAPPGTRIVVVFGAGGDRDRGKRPLMGRAAAAADVVVVTSDNPRGEDPEAIIDEIVAGVPPGTTLHREVDRRRAIELALSFARPGDVVLLAGKGHETTQTVGREVRPFDDREEARAALTHVAAWTRSGAAEAELTQ